MRDFVLMSDVNMDVDPAFAAEKGIAILPQYYHFNDGVIYGDEINLPREEYFARMKAGERAYSMGCNPERVRGILEAALKEEKDVIVFMASSECSGSYNTVHNVAEELMEDYPGSRIYVIDTFAECVIGGMMVEVAQEMKEAGSSFDEICEFIEKDKSNYNAFFMVDDLKYLVRGGRLNAFSGVVGGLLNIKPILHMEDGKIGALAKVRGVKAAERFMIDSLKKMNIERSRLYMVHTINQAATEEFRDQVEKELNCKIGSFSEINPIISAHTGPGVIGIAYRVLK